MKKLKVKVTSYNNHVIIETINDKEDKNFIPISKGRVGNVLIQTDKYLGMSKEAETLIKTIKRSHDDIGDVSTWKTNDNKYCFSWLGGLKKIVDINKSETDKSGIINIPYIPIPNDIPKEAIDIIGGDPMEDKGI